MACSRSEWDMGRFQWMIVLLYGWCSQPWNYANTGIIFVAPKVDHWCRDPTPVFLNLSKTQQKTLMGDSCTRPDVDFAQFSKEELLTTNFSENSYNRTSCRDGYVFDRKFFDWTLTEKMELVCDRAWWRNMINTVYMFGYFLAAVGSGQLGDRFGRRPVLLACGLFGTLAHLACALVPTIHFFVIFRFIGALCDMGVYVCTYVISLELLEPRHRKLPCVSNFLISALFFSLLGALVMVIKRYDHLLFFISGFYFSSLIIQYFTFPESPRWLAAHNRFEELNKIAKRISKMNNDNDQNVLKALKLDIQEEENEKESAAKSNILDLFRTPTLRKRTLVLCTMWFTLVLVWYALMFGLQDFGPDVRISQIISSLLDIPGLLFIMFTIDRLGRQITGFISMLFAGICCLCMSPIVEHSDSYVLMALALLGKMFASMQFFIVYLHTPELYPTVCRTTGLGLCSTVARVAGMLAPQLSLVNRVWPPFLVVTLGLCALISAAITPTIPDTTGKELPQSLQEGEDFCASHKYKLLLPKKRRRNSTKHGIVEENERI